MRLSGMTSLPSTMRLHVSESAAVRDLVRFLRTRDYLAVDEGDGMVEVVPIGSVSEAADRARLLRDLDEWRTGRPPGSDVFLLDD